MYNYYINVFYGKLIGTNSSGKCVNEDMMDPEDAEDYAVLHDHSYMCMEKPCMCNYA